MGTTLFPGPRAPLRWDGSYTTSDGQWVSQLDAAALASALELALRQEHKGTFAPTLDSGTQRAMNEAGFIPVEFDYPTFIENNRTLLRDLAAFCRAGAFQVL